MRSGQRIAACLLLLLAPAAAPAGRSFVTVTFGNDARCVHGGTLKADKERLRFDLSALAGTDVGRAVLRVEARGHRTGAEVRLVPVGLPGAAPLKLRPPAHRSFDATAAVRRWAANAEANEGLRIEADGGVRFARAVLEVSYLTDRPAGKPLAPVTELKAVHRSGQTFLTWREIEDPVGSDAPTFDEFDKAVLAARARRRLVYRVYRHTRPVTVATLGEAQLVGEVPEVVGAWNLKEIRNTEHPNQGTPTKHSVLRPGYNLARNHVMTRYRIADSAEPIPRRTGLAVFTARRAGRHYYAVTAAVDGREHVADLGRGASLAEPIDEKPAKFPAIVYQRTGGGDPKRHKCVVDVYNAWLGPPYHNVPTVAETFVARWHDLPAASAEAPLPLMITTGTHGGSATGMGSPGWHGARRHVKGALTVGVTEGGMWQGFHECIGTLRGYSQGVVHNFPQRRVLAAAAWALWRRDLHLDPQRVYLWGQMAHWGLRHGGVFAVVMSNGYGNLAIGKEAQKHGWKWGPYPKGSKNAFGVDQWEYMNLPKWIRENPTVELPYWLCWPAYGAYPSHSIGDFGFMPWPEMIHAMASTKRAFAANWSTNGPGPAGPLRELAGRTRRDRPLPAFGNCSLDASPGDGDHADAQKGGGINLYQLWDPETIVDEPGRWEITVYLRDDCPYEECTTDLTPRRCRKFRARPGDRFRWVRTGADGDKALQSGTATVDKWGLVTLENLTVTKEQNRLTISRAGA